MEIDFESVDWRRQRICSAKYCTNTVDSTHIRITKCPKCRQISRYKLLSAKLNRLKMLKDDVQEFENTILCKVCSKSLLHTTHKHFCSHRCASQFSYVAYTNKISLENEEIELIRLKDNYEKSTNTEVDLDEDFG